MIFHCHLIGTKSFSRRTFSAREVRLQQSSADIRKTSRRCGLTLTEVLVAAVLLAAAVGLVSKGTVSARRVMQSSHECQIATDELSNQLGILLAMSSQQRDAALQELRVSESVSNQLRDAELSHEIESDEYGSRLTLLLRWKRPGNPPPLSLVGWLDVPAGTARDQEGS